METETPSTEKHTLDKKDDAAQQQSTAERRSVKQIKSWFLLSFFQQDVPLSKKLRRQMILLVVGMPFAAAFIGTVFNPTGWSSGLAMVIIITALLPIALWYITLSVIVAGFILAKVGKRRIMRTLAFLASFIYSLYLFICFSNANEDEFAA